jgi:Methyltransferase domain
MIAGEASSPLAGRLNKSFLEGCLGRSGLTDAVKKMPGMSGQCYRATINNLVNRMDRPRYLEIGSWLGSTAAAAMCGNTVSSICIDNWSQYGGDRAQFERNMEVVQSPFASVDVIESDFREVLYEGLRPVDIFLFDGPHQVADHYDGLRIPQPALAREYVLVVDDWNWRHVRNSTFRALRDCANEVLFSIEVRTTLDNSHPEVAFEASDWHNGYLLAVVRRDVAVEADYK